MSERLRLAVENGHVVLPEGKILVVGVNADSDLSALDPANTRLLCWQWDARERFSKEAWTSVEEPGDKVAGAVVLLPRAREAQKAYLRMAADRTDGPIVVDGSKTNGIDAFYRLARDRGAASEAWSKAHGKVFTVTGGKFDDWPDMLPVQGTDGWWKAPGVFSADGVDKASALLAEQLPRDLKGDVVDLGSGWGYLARSILERDGVTGLHLVENDRAAHLSGQRNILDGRAVHLWRDARVWRPSAPVHHVITNPPFHASRKADPELGRDFIRAAAEMLKPKGNLWLVANRHLPYEQTLEDTFHTVQTLGSNPSFKIFHATSPKRSRKG